MSGVEILGLAASVIQIAELGAKLSVKLFTFTRKVKNANKTIDALSQEIAVTGAVLQQLGETLSNNESVKVCSQEAIDTAKKLVSDTEKVFRNLENLLGTQEKPNSKFRKAVNLKRLKFPFLESEIEQVQANLERLKSSLLVILNVLIFAEQLRNRETLPILQDQRELIRILAAEKDENEQRYERILKAVADRPKPQSDGQSDTSSLHSNTLTLVDPGDNTSHHSVGPTKQSGDKVDELPLIDLPDGLKLYYEKICHHTHLVQNLLSEIDSLEYKLDHSTRGRMHTGVLDVHWNEWNSQRRLFGIHPFEKILHNSAEIATYWADKAINEQLQATQRPPSLESSTPNLLKTNESQSLQTEIDATKRLIEENIEGIMERGERLDQLGTKTDDLVISAESFRRQTQKSSWYSVLSTPVVWVGNALGVVSSIPARLWQGQSKPDLDPPVPDPITFTHEIEEHLSARRDSLAAAIGMKVGSLPESETQEYIRLREQMKQPEFTIDECTEQQVRLFKGVFEDFDKNAPGGVQIERLGNMIRRLGYGPDDGVLNTWCSEVGIKAGDTVAFEKYIEFMLRAMNELREHSIDDLVLDPSTSQQGPQPADNGTAHQIPGGQQKSKPSVDELDDGQRELLKDVFELFERDKSGTVKATELIDIMRSLGQNPTETEIQDLLNQANLTTKDDITFENFTKIMASTLDEPGEEPSGMCILYKRGHQSISVAELFAVMKSLGEISTEAELQDLLDRSGLAERTELTEDEYGKFMMGLDKKSLNTNDSNKKPPADEDLTEMVFEVDADPGPINFDEFSRLINDGNLGDDPGTSNPENSPPDVSLPAESPLLSPPSSATTNPPQSLSDNTTTEPEKYSHKSAINQHLSRLHSHSRRSRSRSRRRRRPQPPAHALDFAGPALGLEPPNSVRRQHSPSLIGRNKNRLPDFYGDHNDGLDLDMDMDMDLELEFRSGRFGDGIPRGHGQGRGGKLVVPNGNGWASNPIIRARRVSQEIPSISDEEEDDDHKHDAESSESLVPESKPIDEVDALILKYTNVKDEELREWTIVRNQEV